MSSTSVFEFEAIGKAYPQDVLGRQRLTALHDVTLRAHAGEVLGLVGPNRAGKTTLVKLLLALCAPTTGRGTRFGRPLHDRSTLARVGYLHEQQALPRYLTAAQLLHYYGALSLLPEPVVRARVPELLERVGLADRSREPIARFSKGMLQRLGLAQALLNQPDLLVLDEPAEGLDLVGRQTLREVIRAQRQDGKAVLLVSHLLHEVEELCDRVAVLSGGRLAFAGTVAELKREPSRSLEQAVRGFYPQPASA